MIYHRNPKWGFEGAPLHDPCTIAWLLKPELFDAQDCYVSIETQGEHTQGMTVVDCYNVTGKNLTLKCYLVLIEKVLSIC